MKKYTLILVSILMICSILIGCDIANQDTGLALSEHVEAREQEYKEESEKFEIVDTFRINGEKGYEVRHTVTGVHYYVFIKDNGYAGYSSMCPVYNADGSIYAD